MKSAPILIIAKEGTIGEPLFLKLSKQFPVVFVSKRPSANIPFSGKFPKITDNKYSHIIAIQDEGSDIEFLHTIIKKAKDTNSDFIFAEALSQKAQHHISKVLREYPSSKVVLYGDVFDNKLIYRYEGFKSVINKFIYQAQRFGKIQILGDGLRETYPVFIEDIVDGLIDLVFGMHAKHSLFYIFPKHPPTELSLAHMIQKANPEILLDFIKHGSRMENISYPPDGKNLLDDKYEIAKKIRNINIKRITQITKDKQKLEKLKRLKRFPFFIVWILIFLMLSPLVFTLFFSFLGSNTLYFAKAQIEKGAFADAKSSLHLSNSFFYIGKKASDILVFESKLIGFKSLKRFVEDIDLGHKISEGLLQTFNSGAYFSKVFNGTSKNPIDDFTKGQNNLKSALIALEGIKAQGNSSVFFIEKIESINPLIKLISNTSDVLASIFGLEGQKDYLVLFQNNMELRPGGGFIGSYGILRLNKGKVTDFSIHDVYDADGQLKGHVEPPFAIRRYLPLVHWYLRDSNFDVDFVKSALSSSNFLNVETGQRVDGVIAIDVTFVKNILHAIGPIYVADYKQTVTDANLFELTETHSEKNFFPSSTQKKDFLRSLYKAIQSKILEGNISYVMLVQAISDSLVQKHLIFAFNSNIQNIFTVNGWSSSLFDERKENKASINDFLGINEANLGVNKVNYFIARQVSQKVQIGQDGTIFSELTINYKNTSTSWPGGDYKNYLRLILPKDTQLSEISIQDTPQVLVDAIRDFQIYEAKDFKKPLGLEIEKVSEENKTYFGFLVNVPVGELVKVKINYTLAKKVSDLSTFSYNLRLFKQPGIDSLTYSFSLFYPNNFNVINKTDGISEGEGKVSYSKKIIEDKDLIVNFARK